MGYYNNQKDKEQIDVLLFEMASLFANTGKDSAFCDLVNAYKKEDELIDEIKKIDPEFAHSIRPYTNEWSNTQNS